MSAVPKDGREKCPREDVSLMMMIIIIIIVL